jgi:protein-S-isoprenylcysteine O-methyltransferase Ste14
MESIVLACWVIFLVYWQISAQSVKPIEETQGWLGGNWYRILTLVGFLFIINFSFLGRFIPLIYSLRLLLIPHTLAINVISIIFVLAGLAVTILARRTLAGNWSGAVALKKGHKLITEGFYAYVRHPIYSGLSLMVLGTALSYGTLSALIGFLIMELAFLIKLQDEERLLMKHFAEEYLSYKQRTKRLIPLIW